MKNYIVRIRAARAYTGGDQNCKVSMIRLYRSVKDCSLKEAKDAVEFAIPNPVCGTYGILCSEADLGRLYLFMRNGNHIADAPDEHRVGFEVLEVEGSMGLLA